MSQRVAVTVTDDLDGTEGASPVSFGLDGTEYEIDLSPEHKAGMRAQLAEYIDHARKATGRYRDRRNSRTRGHSKEVRAWARQHGIAVSERGRIPVEVVDQYEASLRTNGHVAAPSARANLTVTREPDAPAAVTKAASPAGNGTEPSGAGSGAPFPTAREWARQNHIRLAPRGKVPGSVREQYDKAKADYEAGQAIMGSPARSGGKRRRR